MIFNVFGVKVEITFWFIALITFIISLNAPSNVLITVVSSLLHEIGHLLIMTSVGNKPQAIRFEITGMNIIRQQDFQISTKKEVLIALGGPLINFICFLISVVILCIYENENILTFGCINLILMIFNLLPINKLDGGLALYYILSQKFDNLTCTKTLKITSVFFIALIYIWGIYAFVSSKYNISLIIIAIFLTLSMFSCNEY
jgi:stage IV sporulation protein FB